MKPFISRDGADANGVRAEVHVQVGQATIQKIEDLEEATKRNVQVVCTSTHDAVRKPIKGWLQRTDPLLAEVIKAKETGAVINYRVESQRKGHVDRALPIGPLRATTDLARENCIMIFAGMNGMLSQEAVTNPAEDPADGGRVPATGQQATPPARSSASAGAGTLSKDAALAALTAARQHDLPEGVVHAAMAQALAAGITPQEVMNAGVQTAQQRPVEVRTAYATENPGYKAHNSDGRINLGSHAVAAVLGIERFATKLIIAEHEKAEVEVDHAAIATQAAGLTEVLLELADAVQVRAYGGGRVDRLAASHTRARSLVFETIETFCPAPFGADSDDPDAAGKPSVEEWKEDVIARAAEKFRHYADLAMSKSAVEVPAAQAPAQPEQTQPTTAPEPAAAAAPAEPASAPQPTQLAAVATSPEQRPLNDQHPGFTAPSEDLIRSFANLAAAAGFAPDPSGPIPAYLQAKFGVGVVRRVDGVALQQLMDWYASRPAGEAPAKFAEQVRQAVPNVA